MSSVTIRPERSDDEVAIHALTEAAFASHPHSEGAEPGIVAALRADGDLALSLVAEQDGVIVGHAAFSHAILSDGERGWLVLGPISVAPLRQGHGIGRALIEAGGEYWRGEEAKGIVLVGDPAFYARLGFVRGTPLTVEGLLADYFQVLPFGDDIPAATVSFAPAFGVKP